MTTYYKPGTWNAICDICGVQYKSDQLMMRWDGLMVCKKDFEIRHPQSFLKIKNEGDTIPFIRKMADVFITVPFCSLAAKTSLAGYAQPGCMIPGLTGPLGL